VQSLSIWIPQLIAFRLPIRPTFEKKFKKW